MAGFSVDVSRLHRFADTMEVRAEDAVTARRYANEYVRSTTAHGHVFQHVFSALERFRAAIDDHHVHLSAQCRASSAELARAARYYARTDDETAAAVDATFAPPLRPRKELPES